MGDKTGSLKVLNRDVVKYIAIFFMFWGHLFAWLTLLEYSPAGISDPYAVVAEYPVTRFACLPAGNVLHDRGRLQIHPRP